jgi:Mg-chelatase subunit ChlD
MSRLSSRAATASRPYPGREKNMSHQRSSSTFKRWVMMLVTVSLMSLFLILLHRERQLVQTLLEQQQVDRDTHVRDLLQNSRRWQLIPASSRMGYDRALIQARAYGLDSATIVRERSAVGEPKILPPGSTSQIRRVTRVAGSLHVDFQVVSSDGEFISGLDSTSFTLTTADDAPLHYCVTGGSSLFAAQSVAICLDCSDSMAGDKLSSARRATQHLLGHLPPGSRCCLFTFGNDVQAMTPWTTDYEVLTEAAARLQTLGRTALFRALTTASTELADRPGRRHLILCTDGKDTVGGATETELIAQCRQNQIALHTVGISGGDVDLALLERLAVATGGTSQTATNAGAIEASFLELSKQLTEPVYQLVVLDPEQRLTDLQLQLGGSAGLSVPISAVNAAP